MYGVRSMQERVAESLARRRFFEWMLSLFADQVAAALTTVEAFSRQRQAVVDGSQKNGPHRKGRWTVARTVAHADRCRMVGPKTQALENR